MNNIPTTATASQTVLVPFHRYMDYLAKKSIGARIERFPARGNIFHAIEIDGQYFEGVIGKQSLFISRRTSRLRGLGLGEVQLGVAEIHFTREWIRNDHAPKSWFICKYGPDEARITLAGMSFAGRHAIAHEFGISISYVAVENKEPVPDDKIECEDVNGWLFYLSPAFQSLREVAQLHPRKANKWTRDSYLGYWGKAAKTGVWFH